MNPILALLLLVAFVNQGSAETCPRCTALIRAFHNYCPPQEYANNCGDGLRNLRSYCWEYTECAGMQFCRDVDSGNVGQLISDIQWMTESVLCDKYGMCVCCHC
ncbi:hypothetical protein L596_022241 [Steinernema carpocapsae]|uniref:Saposin B-type domain-containing protein n=1 Tax=Steinernema carpocapsae TaxID=34508 RepID=A0A4U5ML42_STECR|nr:hypothetical protein L596_022241 [Steinernema carpocapsae]